MAAVAHTYNLGKDQTFQFGNMIANKDVKTVTITQETSAEGEVTTRGSADMNEYVPIRQNMTLEVVCLAHTCTMHSTATVTIGGTGVVYTGTFYVNNIGTPQEIDGVIEFTISLRKYLAVA
jgi:hypothetical protein